MRSQFPRNPHFLWLAFAINSVSRLNGLCLNKTVYPGLLTSGPSRTRGAFTRRKLEFIMTGVTMIPRYVQEIFTTGISPSHFYSSKPSARVVLARRFAASSVAYPRAVGRYASSDNCREQTVFRRAFVNLYVLSPGLTCWKCFCQGRFEPVSTPTCVQLPSSTIIIGPPLSP